MNLIHRLFRFGFYYRPCKHYFSPLANCWNLPGSKVIESASNFVENISKSASNKEPGLSNKYGFTRESKRAILRWCLSSYILYPVEGTPTVQPAPKIYQTLSKPIFLHLGKFR